MLNNNFVAGSNNNSVASSNLELSNLTPKSPSSPGSKGNFHNSPLSSRPGEGSTNTLGANRSTRTLPHPHISSGATASAQSAADQLLSAPSSAYTPHTTYAMPNHPYPVPSSGLPKEQNQQADSEAQEERPVKITAGRLLGGITMAVAGGIGAAMAFNNLSESEIDWSSPQVKDLAIAAGGLVGVISTFVGPFFVIQEAGACLMRCCGAFCSMLEGCTC